MRRIAIVLMVLCATLVSLGITAQDERRMALALELLSVTHQDADWEPTVNQSLDSILSNNPTMAPYSDILKQFVSQYMGWDAVKSDVAKLYAREFNEDELRQLIDFYGSPVGQRTRIIAARANQVGKEIATAAVAAHKDELTAAIAARKKEIESRKETP